MSESLQLTLVVKSSPQAVWASSESLSDGKIGKAWSKRTEVTPAADNRALSEQLLPLSDTELLIESAEGPFRLGLAAPPLVADLDTGKLWRLNGSAWNALRDKAISLRLRHYGELLDWRDAQAKVPRQSVFRVLDLESGLSFRVQRRAGSQHADVQPMTKADSAAMKSIYGGAWSWKRRAILVLTDDGDRLAASMHGMPHGGDGIPGNDFSGHFCIHFRGSTTHKSDSMDMAHQLMAHKAAGKLAAYLDSRSPEELAAAFIEGVGQQDPAIVAAAGLGLGADVRESIRKKLETIEAVKIDKQVPAVRDAGALEAQVQLTALVSRKGRKPERESYHFTLTRVSLESPWRIDHLRIGGGKR